MSLTTEEKNFVRWALKYLVSANSVNITPEGKFFFRKKFFEELSHQEPFLSPTGKRQLLGLTRKFLNR